MSFDGGGGILKALHNEQAFPDARRLAGHPVWDHDESRCRRLSWRFRFSAGHLYDFHVIGCNIICSTQVTDANGNSIGTGTATERYGATADHFSDESFETAAPTAGIGTNTGASPTIADRWCASGVRFCSRGD